MRFAWKKDTPLIIGQHTTAICSKIDEVIDKYRCGISSFVIITVPVRHGKSDLLSRYLPPRFLGLFPDDEVILTAYGADLASDFSRFARSVVSTEPFQHTFPGITVSGESAAADRWGLAGHAGGMNSVGFGGAITGRGYNLGLVDDYLKNREESESPVIRNKRWDSFTNDFLTRRAPVSITIILATPWHEDDIIGRIKKVNGQDGFPTFEIIRFPAFSPSYSSGTLFPERFSREWYDSQKAALGTYGTSALLQCDPISKGGERFTWRNIKIMHNMPQGLQWIRSWDIASSEKEREGHDPDWTVGVKMAVKKLEVKGLSVPVYHVFVADVKRIRAEATARNKMIVDTAIADGDAVKVVVEAVASYKDAYTEVRDILKGCRVVYKCTVHGDKVQRASPLEPTIDSGNFHVQQAEWNREYLIEFSKFPGGTHDDQVDATANGFQFLTHRAVLK
jgi:predicted phage terminase large subunit-like protein